MTLEQELQQLGLKENEVKVYLAVLSLGEPTVGDIERQIGMHKQLVYNAAERLQNEGLLSIHEIRGRKRFSVPNPAALEDRARASLQKTEKLVPQLMALANIKRAADDIRIYRGIKGVQHYYLETIKQQQTASEVLVLGVNSERYFEIFQPQESAFQTFEQTRTEQKITMKLLLFGKPDQESTLNAKRPHLELRLLSDIVQAPNDIMIWHNRVGMLFYGTEPYVLDLAGENTVEGFRQYFQVLWKQGKSPKMVHQT